MERTLENIEKGILESIYKGYNVAFILLIIGVAGIGFSLLTIPVFSFLIGTGTFTPFMIVVIVGTYFVVVQELRKLKTGLAIGLLFGGIASLGIWPLIHVILERKKVKDALAKSTHEQSFPIHEIKLNELNTETLKFAQKNLKFGTLELVLAILVAAIMIISWLAQGYMVHAQVINDPYVMMPGKGYYFTGDVTQNSMMYAFSNFNQGPSTILVLSKLASFAGCIYVTIRTIMMATILFRQNKIARGVFIILTPILTLGIWQFNENKKIKAEIEKILESRHPKPVFTSEEATKN